MIPFFKFRSLRQKKALMGIGMLFIFVATVVSSAIAAAVLITATETIQERALVVQDEATERLLTGFDIVAVYLEGNSSTDTFEEIEVIIRLRSGSQPVEIANVGYSFISNDASLSASLNDTKINDACTFAALTDEDEFCMKHFFDSNSTLMQTGDMASLLFSLSSANALTTEQDFSLTIQTPKGATQVLNLKTPDLILSSKSKIR